MLLGLVFRGLIRRNVLISLIVNIRRDQKNSRFPGNHCRELVRAGEFFLFFFENLMLDCMHKFRARSHKISTPCKISTPSSNFGFSHDLHDTSRRGMRNTKLAFRLAWSVLCCGHENRVRTRVTRGSGQPKKNLGEGFFGARGPGNLEFFWSRLTRQLCDLICLICYF